MAKTFYSKKFQKGQMTTLNELVLSTGVKSKMGGSDNILRENCTRILAAILLHQKKVGIILKKHNKYCKSSNLLHNGFNVLKMPFVNRVKIE